MTPIKKIITFSFDDCVTQDRRLIQLLDKYGLKATFNINSGLFGFNHIISDGNRSVEHRRIAKEECAELYKRHEIAAHTLTHPTLISLSQEEIIRQTETDRINLERLTNQKVIGFAYPGARPNCSIEVANIIRYYTGIQYARTTLDSLNFDFPKDFMLWHPTCHILSEKIWELTDSFFQTFQNEHSLLFIWGHSYELDLCNAWERVEKYFKYISGRNDIAYMTSGEIYETVMQNADMRSNNGKSNSY